MFSVLGGRPWSELLNGISRRLMEELGGTEDLSFLMFKGVLIMVMMVFVFLVLCSKLRAKERKGMMWPWAMKGNNTMCCCCCLVLEAFSAMAGFSDEIRFRSEKQREEWKVDHAQGKKERQQ